MKTFLKAASILLAAAGGLLLTVTQSPKALEWANSLLIVSEAIDTSTQSVTD